MTKTTTGQTDTPVEEQKTQTKKTTAKKATGKKPTKKSSEKSEAAPKDRKNGVTRPAPNTTSGKIWAIADDISKKLQKPAPRKDVRDEASKHDFNPATVATQYGRWCRYHGLVNPRANAKKETAKIEDAKTTDNSKSEEEVAA